MTIQDKIESRTIGLRRKLSDKSINWTGMSTECLRLRIEEDEFGDEENISIILNDTINVKLIFPSEIPLFRFRGFQGNDVKVESNTGTYLFEILPIEIHTRWEDNVEKGDFIIYKVKDENEKNLYLVLQITESLGVFRKTLIWKKFNSSVYTGQYNDVINNVLSQLDNNTDI